MRVFALILSVSACAATHPVSDITPDQLWNELVSGNKRYVANRADHPHQDPASRATLTKGQHPGVVILGCSDSRVAPELVFDQGLGDLFVIRNAGNIPDNHVLGSIEYAVEHLGSKLVVVLGHSRCGAVTAAVEHGGREGHVQSVVKSIEPALKSCKNAPGDKVENAVRANVVHVVKEIENSRPILARLVKDGKVKVVGARYDLDSGLVDVVR